MTSPRKCNTCGESASQERGIVGVYGGGKRYHAGCRPQQAKAATKTPTAQGISRLLAKAGFTRSVIHTTRIKGWHDWNSGFVVNSYGEGEVSVRYRADKWARGEELGKREHDAHTAYAAAITKAGFAVKRSESGLGGLIVTAGED